MEKWNILLFKFNNDFSFPVGIYGESQVAFSGITIFFLVGVGDISCAPISSGWSPRPS